MKGDPRVDAYIERQAEFAKPILKHLREAVHAAAPEAEEDIKWGMPHFLYKGRILAGMAAFKAHATFGFWRGSGVVGEQDRQEGAMGQFGRLTSIDDLPKPEVLAELIRQAMEASHAPPPQPRGEKVKPAPDVPEDLQAALAQDHAASATFAAFSPSCRREYVDWVTEAKRPETRSKRIAQAVEWMAEGKRRNWKYEKC